MLTATSVCITGAGVVNYGVGVIHVQLPTWVVMVAGYRRSMHLHKGVNQSPFVIAVCHCRFVIDPAKELSSVFLCQLFPVCCSSVSLGYLTLSVKMVYSDHDKQWILFYSQSGRSHQGIAQCLGDKGQATTKVGIGNFLMI